MVKISLKKFISGDMTTGMPRFHSLRITKPWVEHILKDTAKLLGEKRGFQEGVGLPWRQVTIAAPISNY